MSLFGVSRPEHTPFPYDPTGSVCPRHLFRWKVPTWLYIGLWAGFNALIGWAELNHVVPETHVAWWAHIGGFLVGLLWAVLLGRRRFGDGVVT
jgi:membrane associated rhomboid family serine protease